MTNTNEQVESEQNLTDVKRAVSQFYVALNEMFRGNPEPFKGLWSHVTDVTYLGANGGFQVGWEAVYSDWKAQSELGIGGVAEAFDVHIAVGRDMAMSQSHTEHTGGKVGKVFLRESSVFRKENGEWKMIAHHADALAPLTKLLDRDDGL